MKKALTLISLLTTANSVMAETTSVNSNALFAMSGKQYAECSNEITSNYALTAAITEPVYEKAKRDVYRTINQCLTDSQKDSLLEALASVGGAALSYVGCKDGHCDVDDYQEVAKLLVSSQEYILEIFSDRTTKKLKKECSESFSTECISNSIMSVDYTITIEDLGWAVLEKETRIADIKDPATDKVLENIGSTIDYLKGIDQAIKANYSGSNVYMPVDRTIIPIIRDDLPSNIRVLADNTIKLPMFSKPVHVRGQGMQFKLVTEVGLRECVALMKNVNQLYATQVFVNSTNALTTAGFANDQYCGPRERNLLTLIY